MYLIHEQIEQLYNIIQQFDTIILHRHVRPDPDAIGSQLGLRALLRQAFPNKKVLAAGTISQGLRWLGEMDNVTIRDYEEALVIVCDTANQPRIDGDHYAKGQYLVKIDHHPVVDTYGDLQIVHTQASSCSELLIAISRYLNERLPMNEEAARFFYAGILGDTGRFLFDSTTAYTFDCVSFLKQYPFNAYEVGDMMNRITMEEAKFQGFALENLIVNEFGVAHLIISKQDLAAYGVTEEQSNTVVGLPGRIDGITSWCVCVEQESRTTPYYRCRLRSKGPAINHIAERHEGGGHPKASGANAYSLEEIHTIIQELTEEVQHYQ